MHGEKAHSRYFGEAAYKYMVEGKAEGYNVVGKPNPNPGNKELLIIPGASHCVRSQSINFVKKMCDTYGFALNFVPLQAENLILESKFSQRIDGSIEISNIIKV